MRRLSGTLVALVRGYGQNTVPDVCSDSAE